MGRTKCLRGAARLATGAVALGSFLVSLAVGSLLAEHFLGDQVATGWVEWTVAKNFDGTDQFVRQVARSAGEYVENAGTPVFDGAAVSAVAPRPMDDLRRPRVLGLHTTPAGVEKRIEVDISDQKLTAWEGDKKIYEFPVSTGRAGYDTVRGEFRVWRKVRNQAYRGGSGRDYYYLPNVPYSLFFSRGYAIHGTYWHNDFGIRRRSAGCVNLRIPDAEKLYRWAGPALPPGVNALNAGAGNPGARVVVRQ